MEYKIRKLNLLDIRHMARILREIKISKEDFAKTVTDIFDSAKNIRQKVVSKNEGSDGESGDDSDSDSESGDNGIGDFISALMPAINIMLDLLADSDSFWEFLAGLLNISYAELESVGINEVKDIISSIVKDEQFVSFFTSSSEAATKEATTELFTTSLAAMGT